MIPQHDKQGNRVQLLYYSSTAHYCLSFRRSLVTDRQGGIHLRVNHCRYFVPRRGGGKLSMTSSRTGVQLYTTVQSPTRACHSDAAWLIAGREESVFALIITGAHCVNPDGKRVWLRCDHSSPLEIINPSGEINPAEAIYHTIHYSGISFPD